MRQRAVVLSLVAACAGGTAACSREAPPPPRPAPPVSVLEVKPQTIPFVSTFVAQTESSQQVDILARVSGFLDRIAYREGEVVKEGQVLFQLDPKPLQAQLDAAKGSLAAQQARLSTARTTLDRVKPLAAQNAVSQADLDRAQGEFEAATAAVYTAQAQVTEAGLNLGYATIRSPVTGVASRATVRQGAYVNAVSPDAKLTYVAALDPIWVNFSVSQNQMARMRELTEKGIVVTPRGEDLEVELTLPDGTPHPQKGRISFADPSFSQDTGTFLVRAVLPNPKHELRPGMFVNAVVRGAVRPNAIVVPQLAVQQGPNGHVVFVVKDDGTAEVRPVVVGDYYGKKDIVVTSGLHAGDRVVVDGVLKVVPGQPVKIVEAGAAEAAAKAAKAGGAGKR